MLADLCMQTLGDPTSATVSRWAVGAADLNDFPGEVNVWRRGVDGKVEAKGEEP